MKFNNNALELLWMHKNMDYDHIILERFEINVLYYIPSNILDDILA